MKLKLTMLLGLLIVASLVLTACGGAATPTQAAATEPPAATEAPATEAPTAVATEAPAQEPAATLKIWGDDTRTPLLQELAPGFQEKYGVELNVEDLGKLQDIRSQVILAVPAGEG